MKMMWCWRCKSDMPMLDEEEYARIHQLFGEAMKGDGAYREKHGLSMSQLSMDERFRPVVKEYERLTGVAGLHHNTIMHHRMFLFGPPCGNCGKPLRTPNAKLCVSCGQVKY